jgi:hypothetical protein
MANEFVARNGLIAQDNSIISGSLIVTNGITGSISGTGSYANNANSASYSLTATSASYAVNAASAVSASYALDATSASFATTASYWTGSVNAITSSFATNAGLLNSTGSNGFTTTSSFQTYTSSNDLINTTQSARLTSLEGVSASFFSYTQSNNANIASIYGATSSLQSATSSIQAFSSSILSYTASTDNKIGALNSFSSSILSYTSSTDAKISSINLATASLNFQTASLLSYTSSTDAKIASIYNNTSSLNAFSGSILNYTSSTDAKISALYTYTSSLNNKTSSFATTGSNTFIGNQTITGSINVSGSINATGTLTAQTLIVQVITSSQDFVTGSTKFGTLTSNTHQFTGSVSASGSLAINTNVLYADGTSVGIGTTSPTDTLNYGRALDIQSSTGAAIYLRDSSNTALYGLMAYDGDATNRTSIGGFGTGNYVRLISEGNEAIRIVGGNVGIGATSPGSLLQLGNYGGNPTLTFAATGNGTNRINFYDSNNTEGLYLTTTGELYGGTMTFGARWDDDEAKIVFKMYQVSDGGSYNARVGIGTTSPNRDLHINGSSDVRIQITDSDQGTTSNDGMYIRQFGVNTAIVNQENGSLQFGANNNYVMTLLSGGNVGIGTTNPGSNLHIKGSNDSGADFGAEVRVWENAYGASLQGSTQGNTAAFVGNFRYNFTTAGSSIQNYPNAGQGILFKDGIHVYSSNPGGSGGDTFTPSERLTIKTDGNVGIGTTSPTARLQISGDGSSYNQLRINHNGSGTNGFLDINVTDTRATILTNYSSTNIPLEIKSYGNTNQLFLATGGNIGIGTSNPQTELHIAGISGWAELRLAGSTAGSGGSLEFYSGSVQLGDIYMGSSKDLTFRVNGASTVMYIKSDGNVGIGTTSPDEKLRVSGKIKADAVYVYDGLTTGQTGIGASSSGGDLRFYQNGSIGAVITTTGNVGIGTTSPQEYLHIVGTNDFTRGLRFSEGGNNYRNGIYFGSPGGSNSGWGLDFYTAASSTGTTTNLSLRGNGVSYFNAGNVGIGTTSPNAPLHVWKDAGDGNSVMRIRNTNSTFRTTTLQFEDYAGAYADGLISFNVKSGAAVGSYLGMGISTTGSLVIAYGGNIGIGSISPGYTLDVVGSLKTTAGTYLGTSSSNVIVGGTTSDVISSFKFIAIGNTAFQYGASTGTYLRIEPGNADTEVALKADARSGAYPPMTFYTTATERMRIKADGNIGISTTSPLAILHVQGLGASPNADSVYITNKRGGYFPLKVLATQGDYQGVLIEHEDGTGSGGAGPSGSYGFKFDDKRTSSTYSGHPSASFVIARSNTYNNTNIFEVRPYNAQPAIAVATGGNVGIGTTSPSQKLHIMSGSVLAEGGGTNNGIIIGAAGNNVGGAIKAKGVSNEMMYFDSTNTVLNGESNIYFRIANGDKVTINSNGNVGIGTTSPAAPLHVASENNNNDGTIKLGIRGWVQHRDAGSTIFSIANDYNSDASKMEFRMKGNTTSDAKMTILGNGNVGIGTASPGYKLDVKGTGYFDGPVYVGTTSNRNYFSRGDIRLTDASSNVYVLDISVSSTSGYISTNYYGGGANMPLVLQSYGNNNQLYLATSGNVGINTTAPTEKLQVDGYILNRSKLGFVQRHDIVKNGLSFYVDFNNKNCWDPVVDGTPSGTSVKDLSNNKYLVAFSGTATVAAKDGNYGLYGNGAGNYMAVKDYTLSSLPHTWEAWVLADGLSGYDTFWDSGTERPLFGALNSNPVFYPDGAVTSITLSTNKWYHFVVAMASNNTYQFYMNGRQISSTTYGSVIRTGTFDMWLGGDNSAESWNGYVPIARMYNRQLSATEVMQNYNAEKWRFDNNSTFYHDVATGNVGIGTTSPLATLHVLGSDAGFRITGTSRAQMLLTNATSQWQIESPTGASNVPAGAFGIIESGTGTRLTILTGGNVGIGTTGPAYLLDVAGTIRATGDVIAYSDARVKENVNTITDALTKVTSLRGVSYTRKDTEDKSEKVGVIAQEVLEILPQVVQQDDNGNYSVAYGNIVGVLIEAIKELNAKIDRLENK